MASPDEEFIRWLLDEAALLRLERIPIGWTPPSWLLRGDGKGSWLLVATGLRDAVVNREFVIRVSLQ